MEEHMSIDYEKLILSLSRSFDIDLNPCPLASIMKAKSYKKGDYYCELGEDCTSMGIVASGVFKVFYLDHKGKEYVRAFPAEGAVVGPLSDILQGNPSSVYAQALGESLVANVNFQDFRNLFSERGYIEFYLRIIESKYIEKEKRTFELISNRSQDRLQFLDSLPRTVIAHANNSELASYLNMTPETLSRIKNT